MKYEVKTIILGSCRLEENPEVLVFLEAGWEPFAVSVGAGMFLYLRRVREEEYQQVEATSWEL